MENQRIRISKTMLKSGLIQLLKKKSLNQITVSELCKVSQINRTTFYKYYGSPIELLNEIEADFLKDLNDDLQSIIAQNPNALICVLEHLYEQRELFCLLIKSIPMQEFAVHLSSIPGIHLIFQNLSDEASYSETETKYIKQFIFQGTFSVLYEWLSSEKPESVEEIAKVLVLLKNKL